MVSPAITTIVKIMETLPEETQSQVVEHLREWLLDNTLWDKQIEADAESGKLDKFIVKLQGKKPVRILSPRLLNPEDVHKFKMEVEALEELIEDIGLGNAMQGAEHGEFVSEDEIQKILRKED